MSLRHFFTKHAWWGKLFGAFFGYLVAGPIGIFFGLIIGNFFDKGLHQYFSNPYWHFHIEKRPVVQQHFIKAMFSILGNLAKADGRVTKDAIAMAKNLMDDFGLNHRQQLDAQALFNAGKNANFNCGHVAAELYAAAKDNPLLLKLFVDIQYRAAQMGGFTAKKLEIMNTILNALHFAPLYQQNRFYEDFIYHNFKNRSRQQSGYSGSTHNDSHQSNPFQTYQTPLSQAFEILEIKPTSNKQDIKRAYRRLMSRHHPDKLMAKGATEKAIKMANEKTQKIRKAYEQICQSNGWS